MGLLTSDVLINNFCCKFPVFIFAIKIGIKATINQVIK